MADRKVRTSDANELAKATSNESVLGGLGLKFEPAAELADITPDQLARLQALEQELGVIFWLAHR
jgi:hypothetical protein